MPPTAPDPAPTASNEPGPLAKTYWLTVSTTTENTTDDDIRATLPTHLAWLDGIEREGKLFMSGPLLSGPDVRMGAGIIVLRADDEAEARAISEQDPLVTAGLRTFALYRWLLNEGSVSLELSLGHGTYRWA